MPTEQDYVQLCADTLTEFPDFKIEKKSSSLLMKAINVVMMGITFGFMKSFMDRFITTIGTTMYVPDSWDARPAETRLRTLRHERVHMRQSKRYGKTLYTLMYLFGFPTVLAFGRKKLEQEAYEESIRATLEYFGEAGILDPKFRESMVKHFTTAEYFWMWPWKSSVEAWYDGFVEKLRNSK
jgi:hypothetical protein